MQTLVKINNSLERCDIKLSTGENGDEFKLSGLASVYNGNDAVDDTFLPGAWENVVKQIQSGEAPAPFMFFNHRHFEVPIGGWDSVAANKTGLQVAGEIDKPHKDGPTIFNAVKRKRISGLSVGIKLVREDFELKDKKDPFSGRNIKNVTALPEISIVTVPADDAARVTSVKSVIDTLDSVKDCENFLREVGGFSHSAARDFVSVLKKLVGLREVDALQVGDSNTKAVLELFDRYKLDLD